MKKYFGFLLLFFFISCNSKLILPSNLELILEKEFATDLDNIRIYSIHGDSLSRNIIKNHPIASELYGVYKWEAFANIPTKERNRIIGIVSESNDLKKSQELESLINKIKSNQIIYFSAYYSETIYSKNRSSVYYENIFFLDSKNYKLYDIKPLKYF